jgi:hypothetical protein
LIPFKGRRLGIPFVRAVLEKNTSSAMVDLLGLRQMHRGYIRLRLLPFFADEFSETDVFSAIR